MLMQNLTLVVTKRITVYGGPWISFYVIISGCLCLMNWWPRPLSLSASLSHPPFSSLLSCVMENTANESRHCTVQYVYMYNCTCLPGPCPWCREYCYFPGLSLGKGRKVVDLPEEEQSLFSQQFVPNFWSALFGGTNNTSELHSICRNGRKEENWENQTEWERIALNVSYMFFLFKKMAGFYLGIMILWYAQSAPVP